MSEEKPSDKTKFPPNDLDALRLIITRMKSGELDLPIGKKSFSALNAMMEKPEIVAESNIVELSEQLNVSPASLSRLAKLMGFTGFTTFQNLFKTINNLPTTFYSQNLATLFTQKGSNTKQFLLNQANTISMALEAAVSGISSEAFEEAARLLIKHKRVYIFGFRQPASIASMLRYGLTLLRGNVHMFSQGDHGAALSVSQLRPEDLLVLFSSSPYSDVTVKIAGLAKERRVKILAITDSKDSPLKESADVCLVMPCVEHFYVNSQVLNIFLVENLLNTSAAIMGEVAKDNIRNYEKLLKEFRVNL